MTETAVKRPPILAGACLYLGVLAGVMAIRAITVVSSWNGDNRASDFADALAALRDAGLSASDAETAYKSLLTVIAVLAATGAVFAVYTARGDRASRIGMTITIGIAGFLTFTGLLGGTFFFAMLGALATVFTARLWTGEIRTYFRTLAGHGPAAIAPHPTETDPISTPVSTTPTSTTPTSTTPTNADQATTDPFAEPYRQPAASQPLYGNPEGYQQPWPAQTPPAREPLPTSVSIAVWTTFVGSIAAVVLAGLMLLAIVGLGVDYETVVAQGGPGVDMIRGSESDFNTAMRFIVVISSISVVLGIGGLLAAIRVLVTRRSGDVPLFVMAVVTVIFSVIAFPLGLPWTAAAIVALVQLRRSTSKRWFVKT